jgi:cytochrome c-type biogenesis protein CcmE
VSRGSPVRLAVALSVAGALAVFLLYTSIAGGATPTVTPSMLAKAQGRVTLAGIVAAPVVGSAESSGGLRFALRDPAGGARVPVVYHGAVPDLFGVGKRIYLDGRLRRGAFIAVPGSLVTKCPSKYVAKKGA